MELVAVVVFIVIVEADSAYVMETGMHELTQQS